MIRLKDIAAKAGVSVMTVSKVMRDAHDISSSTKARVRKLAQEMGYVPDSLAQGLRTRTTKLLGLVVSNLIQPAFARTALALEEGAHELGYELILSHSKNLPEREESCLRRLLSRRVDGLFIAPVYRLAPTAPIYDEIQRNGLPVVVLGHRAPFCARFHCVESDDVTGSYLMTRHLLELGHRRVAFFAGPAASPWAQERCEGYRRALREAGIEFDDRFIFTAGSTIDEGAQAAQQMLAEKIRPTAIQAVNDLVALGVAGVLLEHGLRIPEDLSLAGFGNNLAGELFRVPLTTVREPEFRLGAAAMEIMVKLLRREPAEAKRLPAELIVRASTAVPSK